MIVSVICIVVVIMRALSYETGGTPSYLEIIALGIIFALAVRRAHRSIDPFGRINWGGAKTYDDHHMSLTWISSHRRR